MKLVKFIFIFSLLILNYALAENKTISLKATYTEASAKIEAFKDVERKIEKDFYKKYLKDPNWKENLEYMEAQHFYPSNRFLCPFYLKKVLIAYSISYDSEDNLVLYYTPLGHLNKFEITNDFNYPRKTLGYSRFGNLITVVFETSENEQFVYNKNGKLLAHWKDDKIVDKKFLLYQITRGLKD